MKIHNKQRLQEIACNSLLNDFMEDISKVYKINMLLLSHSTFLCFAKTLLKSM